MMQRHTTWRSTILFLATACILAACSSIGLSPPQSFDEKLAYQYGNVAGLRTAAATALMAKQITVADAEHVQTLADQARALLDDARVAQKLDPALATNRLVLATTILTQLQTFISARGSPK